MSKLLENIARAILNEQNRAEHALCNDLGGVNRQVDRLAMAQKASVQNANITLATVPQHA